MTHKIEFLERDGLGKGLYIAVIINRATIVGRIERNNMHDWCYFPGDSELNPEIVGRDLDAVKAKVTSKLR